jgi:Ser/Thr protein kinase RdoA (MazF antagonist)
MLNKSDATNLVPPVSYSRFSIPALEHILEETFNLAKARCQLIKATINDVYRVWSENGSYILRIHRHNQRSLAQIVTELDLLGQLKEAGFEVPTAIPRPNTEQRVLNFDAPEGLRFGILFTFLEGSQLSKNPDTNTIQSLGRILARLHSLSATPEFIQNRPVFGFSEMIEQPVVAFRKVGLFPEVVNYLENVSLILKPYFKQFPCEAPYYGLVHGDLIPSNILIGPVGQVQLIDFDFCGTSWHIFDIGCYLRELDYWQARPSLVTTFLESYQQIRPLADWELAALPIIKAATTVLSYGTPALNVNEWGSSYLSDSLVNTLTKSLQRSMAEIS